MKRQKKIKNKISWKLIVTSVLVVIFAMLMEFGILVYINNKSSEKTSKVLLDQVIGIIDENRRNEEDMLASLKNDYMIRARAVSYMIDSRPESEQDIGELNKMATLMSVDEIHLFDATGTIYSGTIPKYYGYSFDSGDQMGFFKPMLKDKGLTMCQDVTPNTSEGKEMMYAITWNEEGTHMVQVGIKPVRLLEEVKQNEIAAVIGNMPTYEGMHIYVADADTGIIRGATESSKIGRTISKADYINDVITDGEPISFNYWYEGERYNSVVEKRGDYLIGILYETAVNDKSNLAVMAVMAAYLIITVVVLYLVVRRLLMARDERDEQIRLSNTDELTGCLNRRAYEDDIHNKLSWTDKFVYVSMDVDGLKMVNDTMGHAAGDELIKGAASCMTRCYGENGKVYRIGGDEFVAIVFAGDEEFAQLKKNFDKKIASWHGKHVSSMVISSGYVFSDEKKWDSVYDMAKAADRKMYDEKNKHYETKGLERRR